MFKTETHMHVAEVSKCAQIRAAEIVRLYNASGYKTLFVTDHYTQRFLDSLGDIPHEDKVTIFLSTYYKAKEEARRHGMNVILGAEISLSGVRNDYLAYGVTREFFNKYPDLCKMKIDEFSRVAKENGVFLVQAHPYRDNFCYPTPEYVEGIEVYNSHPRHDDKNELAEALALEHGLYMLSGSDAHREEDVGRSGVLSEVVIESSEQFISLLKEGKLELIKEDKA